jgi:hypothetical protein
MLTIFATLALAMQGAAAPAACPPAVRVAVYRSPSLAARKTDRLRAGTRVLVCGEQGGWAWVAYASRRNSCVPARGATCATGWVDRRRLAALGS